MPFCYTGARLNGSACVDDEGMSRGIGGLVDISLLNKVTDTSAKGTKSVNTLIEIHALGVDNDCSGGSLLGVDVGGAKGGAKGTKAGSGNALIDIGVLSADNRGGSNCGAEGFTPRHCTLTSTVQSVYRSRACTGPVGVVVCSRQSDPAAILAAA